MKKILCAVDFSAGSLHALDYAIKVACVFNAGIEMVWVDNSTEASRLSAISRDVRLEVKKQFEEILDDRKDQCSKVNLTYKLKKGKVYQEIASLARSGEADLIIAGSHGVSGFEQHWIGSNANRIVSHAPVPVITLRSSYDVERDIKRIILPIDSTAETKMKVPFTASFAKAFGATVHVLALFSTNLRSLQRKVEYNADAACNELEKAGINSSCEKRNSTNITKSAIAYAEEIDADLIAIMTEKETSTSNILLGHFAQQMVNNSNIPVLSVNPGK